MSDTGAPATAQRAAGTHATEVTVRSAGMGRWFAVAFLAIWLAAWAVGEVFALGFLGLLGGARFHLHGTVSLPTGALALAMASFLLVWLTLWTLAGVAALTHLLRTGWGVDRFTLAPDGWTVWQGVGRWGRARRVEFRQVRHVALQRNHGALVADVNGRMVTLTPFGTPADRRWLCERLREAAGIDASHPHGAALPDGGFLPAGYRSDRLPDGSTRVTPTLGRRLSGAGCLLLLALFWNGITGVFVLAGLKLLPVKVESDGLALGSWGYWLVLTPFILAGLALLGAVLRAVLVTEEWRLGPNVMEIRRISPRWVRGWRYQAATLALNVKLDSDGDECWSLDLLGAEKPRRLESGDPARLRALGLYLAAQTGWPLREPPNH